MNEHVTVFRPNVKQRAFLRSSKRQVGYGGARGGGKSWVVRMDACLKCRRYPGFKALIVRLSYPELEGNHILPLRELLHGIATYNESKKRFVFPNGSSIKLDYCGSDADVMHYQGQEYDAIYIDEATNLRQQWIEKIRACNRGHNSFPHQIYYTMNPGGVSHGYFKRLFIDKQYRDTENPDDYEFIQALVTDNRALMDTDPEYVKLLEGLPPKLRDAWLGGSWDLFEGQVFEELRVEPDVRAAYEAGFELTKQELLKQRRFTHVIEPFEIPKGWQLYRSFDWGYHRPFSTGYWAIDYDGTFYRIDEFYGVQYSRGQVLANEGLKWTPDRVFAQIQRYERERWPGRKINGVADPAIWDAETGESYAETAARYGLFFAKGDHERIPGWMQCHYRLQFDENGYPRMYVFSNCKNFIRTIPLLQYDEHKTEDIDTDGEDHIADEWRYFCMTRPIKPMLSAPKPAPKWGSDPLDQF